MPNFVYNRDIPDAPNNPSNDQGPMKTNTNSIDDIFEVDHYSFNDANGGWHQQATFPSLIAAPTTAALQGAIYTKNVGGGVTQLFYRRENNGSEIQITSSTSVINTPTILSGSFNAGIAFSNIVLLPANVYGFIIFFNSSSPAVQMGQFFTDATKSYGFSNRIVKNGSSSDDPVELNNSSASLNLQGKRDDFGSIIINWRLHYWSL